MALPIALVLTPSVPFRAGPEAEFDPFSQMNDVLRSLPAELELDRPIAYRKLLSERAEKEPPDTEGVTRDVNREQPFDFD